MEINSAISLLSSLATGMKELKAICQVIPIWMFLPPNRQKLIDIKTKINSLEEQVNQVNSSLPKLIELIPTYSKIIADVRLAGSLADKLAELVALVPNFGQLTMVLVNERYMDYTRIAASIQQLPYLDVSERGSLETKLNVIRDITRDMKNLKPSDSQMIEINLKGLSTQYSDIESILSSLLNKILAYFEIEKNKKS